MTPLKKCQPSLACLNDRGTPTYDICFQSDPLHALQNHHCGPPGIVLLTGIDGAVETCWPNRRGCPALGFGVPAYSTQMALKVSLALLTMLFV